MTAHYLPVSRRTVLTFLLNSEQQTKKTNNKTEGKGIKIHSERSHSTVLFLGFCASPTSNNSCFSQMEWGVIHWLTGSLHRQLGFYALHLSQDFATHWELSPSFLQATKPHFNTPSPQTPKPMDRFRALSSKMFLFLLPAPSQTPQGTAPLLTLGVRILFCYICTNTEGKPSDTAKMFV